MALLRENQLNIMMFMSGVCGILAIMTLFSKSLPRRRKKILATMEFAAMMLLLFDRFCYMFRGDVTELGYFMVRICNGAVFFLSLTIPHLVTIYINDLLHNEGRVKHKIFGLGVCDKLYIAGVLLLGIAQFTGIYYTFDERNNYQRSPLFALSYIFPLLILILQEVVIYRYRRRIKRQLAVSLGISIAYPTLMSVVQIFTYGLSLINMSTAFVVIIFFVYSLNDINEAAERAKERELEFYKKEQEKELALFEQTTEALANAIDAKDNYTHGHSTRVAAYSKQIAKKAGFDDKKCRQVYFAALLHDVGKIGIRHDIINKNGKLTEEEYEQIKLHPVFGSQILSSIRQSPYLSVGAHYHHERYDGTGYPDGLSGKDIPEIARIIAVADAYDAMTSYRSYRDPLPTSRVKSELIEGAGTQFDPDFAMIMLELIESGSIERVHVSQ